MAKKVRVLRMENDKGQGPYMPPAGKSYNHWHQPLSYTSRGVVSQAQMLQEADTRRTRHPDEFNESGHKYAFSTEKQAHAWFNSEEQSRLAKRGFALNAYDVPKEDVKKGKKSVAYKPERAEKLPTPKIVVED